MQFSPTGSICSLFSLCLSVLSHVPSEDMFVLASGVVTADQFFEVRKGIFVSFGLTKLCTGSI